MFWALTRTTQPWQFIDVGVAATGSNPDVPVPATFAAGDLLVTAVASRANPGNSSGFSTAFSSGSGLGRAALFYKISDGTETSMLCTGLSGGPGSFSVGIMLAYRQINATPLDAVGTQVSATGTSVTFPSAVATYPNGLTLYVLGVEDIAGTITSLSIPTERVNIAPTATLCGMYVGDFWRGNAGGTPAFTITVDTSMDLGANVAVFRSS